MAALIKAANAKIRSNPVTDYLCSTHFWGPVSNYSIPLAAVLDTRKSPELISPKMTGALTVYAFTFMRFSLAITPKNYLLFACHTVNACAQTTQGYRYLDYHYWGGKESGKYASLSVEKKNPEPAKMGSGTDEMVVKPPCDGVHSVVKDVKAPEGKKK